MPDDAPENGPEDQDSPEDDTAAEQALADAAAQEAGDDPDEGEDEGLPPAVARKIAKANREAQNLRQRLKELEPSVKELQKIKDGQKSEAQKLTEERDKLLAEISTMRADAARRQAAADAGLPAKFARFITADDEEGALAQAKELAKELGLDSKGQKKSPDLRQGQRGPNNTGADKANPDDLLRRMARR